MKKIPVIVGIVMMGLGFLTVFYKSFVLLPPTEPPFMTSLEGLDSVIVTYEQVFWYVGVFGFIITAVGLVFLRKKL